ncbi:PIF-like [Octopus vulgaris]|uniref:PIF-like n=1 Tax=Octopus vulgaris TaxID=6645 RepID=A0AA36FD04_OCTVU|nr:PIF-like [Octopus vulgaris]
MQNANSINFSVVDKYNIGLVGAAYEAYCRKCVAESQQASLFPHPERCDYFIQCDVSKDKTLAYEKACPPTLFFDSELRICGFGAEKCNAICNNGDKFKAVGYCNKYYECANSKFDTTLKSCADKEAFSADTSTCVPDANCPPVINVLLDCSNFTLDTNPQVYFHNGVRQSCASGLIFNLTTCSCQLAIAPTVTPVCTLFDLPMLADFDEKSAGRSVLNNGAVISNGAAYFKNASIVLPAFILNDFGEDIQITVDCLFENPTKSEIPVLNNGNCDLAPTVSFMVKDAMTSNPILEATIKVQNVLQAVTLQATIAPNTWSSFKLTKKGDDITLWKNDKLVDQKTEAGAFEYIDAAMVLGKATQKGSFEGYLKNLRVTKCPA